MTSISSEEVDVSTIKFGVVSPFAPVDAILFTCKLAEKLGFNSTWIGDHVVGHWGSMEALDAWTMLGAVSVNTKRISLGIVTDPVRRHPAILAHTALTLDHISKGRFILCIGAGEAMNIVPYGIPFDQPVSRMQEVVVILKRLWREDSVTYEGQFYQLHNAQLEPKPVQKSGVPMYIAGNSTRTMELTGRYGDGWLPFRLSPDLYKKNLDRLREYVRKCGRSEKEVEPCLWLFTGVSENYKRLQRFKEVGKRLMLLSPKILVKFGHEVSPDLDIHRLVITKETYSDIEVYSKKIPDEVVDETCVIGTPNVCIEKIEKYVKSGARHIILIVLNPLNEMEYVLRTYSKEIMPCFEG